MLTLSPCARSRALLRAGFLCWDTETTGLENDAAMVSIGIVSHTGDVLLDTLINPLRPIPPDATAIHGITDDMVQGAPTFADLYPQLARILHRERWVIYNANYDMSRLYYECRRAHQLLLKPALVEDRFSDDLSHDAHCAMLMYAEFHGEWNDYHGNYRWQKLSHAAQRFGIQRQAHHALADAITTLDVLRHMALHEDRQPKKELHNVH